MSSATNDSAKCQVVGGDKLPAETGGATALCAAIEASAARQAPNAEFSVVVRVLSPSSLAAVVRTADGRTLPEQNYAISDRALNKTSFERFAEAVGAELARANGR